MLLPRSVANISNVCGADRTKYALDTVQLSRDDKGNALAVASDGKRVLVAKWKDKPQSEDYAEASNGEANVTAKPDLDVLIPVKPWDEIFKAIPKKCKAPVLEHALLVEGEVGKTIPLETREDDGTVRRICPKPVAEIGFPDWRESVPDYQLRPSDEKSNEAVRLRLDAELLAELIKTVWVTAGKSNNYVDVIVPFNLLKPIEIRSHNEEGVRVTGLQFPIMAPDTVTPFQGALPANPGKPTLTPEVATK